MTITPRERVYNALRRKPTDRVPLWMWYHPDIYDRLKREYGWEKDEADSRLGNDIKQVHISINREMFRPLAVGEKFTDDWGVTWVREGWYNQVCRNPLADEDSSSMLSYRFPDPESDDRFAPLAELCGKFGEEYFIGADVSGSIFEPSYHIRGMDKLMADMIERPESAGELFDRAAEFTMRVCLRAMDFPIDWIWLGDDVGGQSSMMISPSMWREMLKPRLAGIIKAVKEKNPDIPVAYHSCGAIRPIIPDLIEIGADVLNPIQPLCPGMEPASLKAEFGDRLAFMGGLDTQEFLIKASAEEVCARGRALVETMSAGGGYIFAASHTIQPDTSLGNILALSRLAG